MRIVAWVSMGLLFASAAGCDQDSARLEKSSGDVKPKPELLSPDRKKGDPPVQPTTIQPPPVAGNSGVAASPSEPPKK